MVSEVGPTFVGGRTKHFFSVDFDHLSIPELIDIAKEFEVNKLRTTYIAPKGGDLIKIAKDRDLLDLGVLLNDGRQYLEIPSSPNSFKVSEENRREEDATSGDFQANNTIDDVDNSNSSSDEELVNESDSELFDDYESDGHEELRVVVREGLREYKKNKVVRAAAKEKVDGFLGEAGVDEGYEDIDREIKSEG
ncbi:hypothetical protein K7X08_016800 [Anisodus acutangulus]|uniref:Uncharacterized protein n=1 Tax=Anisodus acutangulus TaxID=402998 RepID=A0A9Q1LR85_9SOLA|nr:hypothetical protein K7X08_016800 [Anisodus acutangulus]